MDLIPPSDIQPWLKKKMAAEDKFRQQEANSETMSQNAPEDAQPRPSENLLAKPDTEHQLSVEESRLSRNVSDNK